MWRMTHLWCFRTGSIEVVITTEKMTAQKSGTSAAAAAAAFSMAGRIRRLVLMGETEAGKALLKHQKSQFLSCWGFHEYPLDFDRKQDFLMKLHIPVVDKRKKRLNRSCSVLTKAGWTSTGEGVKAWNIFSSGVVKHWIGLALMASNLLGLTMSYTQVLIDLIGT